MDMKPSVKYWIFLAGITCTIFVVILASVAGSWLNLSPDEQAYIYRLAEKIIPFPLLGALTLVVIVGGLVSLLFRYYIIPILRMAESTQLMSVANPGHRITPCGARETRRLAEVVNAAAEAYQKLRDEVDALIRSSQAELKEERNRFAALMSELPTGVLVCNSEGQLLLYNHLAQALLSPPGREQTARPGQEGRIGLGRSIFGVLQREPILHGMKLLQEAVGQGESSPTTRFMLSRAGGRSLRVIMAPVFSFRCEQHDECVQCERRMMTGLVLTLEDMTPRIESETRRDQLLKSLTGELQADLDELRRLTEAVSNQESAGLELAARCTSAMQIVSLSLQRIILAQDEDSRHLQLLARGEEVLGDHLLETVRKNIEERLGIDVEYGSEPGVWIRVDSYALMYALSHLAVLLKNHAGLKQLRLDLKRDGEGTAILAVLWPGCTVEDGIMALWREMPLASAPDGSLLTVSQLTGGDNSCVSPEYSPDGSHGGVSIRFSTLPTLARAEVVAPPGPRPVYYEFDLFEQRNPQELGSQSLRRLTYVVFDTETTGLDPAGGDEIIQIGAVRIVNGRILEGEMIDQLIDPGRQVPDASSAIHGITTRMVAGQPTIGQVLPDFSRFTEGAVLVAHNAAFDMRCLQLKERQTGVRFDNPVLDTLLLSSVVHPHQESHSLEEIARRLNVPVIGRHTALGDAIVTAEVLLRLIPILESNGIATLTDALRASSRSPFARISY